MRSYKLLKKKKKLFTTKPNEHSGSRYGIKKCKQRLLLLLLKIKYLKIPLANVVRL